MLLKPHNRVVEISQLHYERHERLAHFKRDCLFAGLDPLGQFADADTGVWKWRLKSNYPIFGGVTPTAGGLVFFGDMGGNFYALDTATGQKLWGQKIDGAIGGGVITYTVNGAQKVAVAAGYVSPAVPAEIRRAKIAILGLEGD